MEFINRFFKRRKNADKLIDEFIINKIENICETVAHRIFLEYRDTILESEANYITSSVWGVDINGEIDGTQKSINELVKPQVQIILNYLDSDRIGREQASALQYLLNGYIVSKLFYMREMYKNLLNKYVDNKTSEVESILLKMDPIGKA